MKLIIQRENGDLISDNEYPPPIARKRMAEVLRQERRAKVPIKKVHLRIWALGPVPFAYRLLIVALIA